jgi:CubicO group peptidase (beta-lactamase class C family)
MATIEPEDAGFCAERLKLIDRLFQRLIEEREFAGLISLVVRHGKIAHFECVGHADVEADSPMRPDTIFRIYSMTKPITSVSVLMLMEEGLLRLDDPISKHLPAFGGQKVLSDAPGACGKLVAPYRPPTIFDLLTHTAGLTYGWDTDNLIDRICIDTVRSARNNKVDMTLAEMADLIAAVPLAFQPGTRFLYSYSTDVLGCIVQAVSGQSFESFLQERIFGPLGMPDTSFCVPANKLTRFAACYGPSSDGGLKQTDPIEQSNFAKPGMLPSGGGGLVSTAGDYLRFAQMLLRGGEYDTVRILGRKTVELMTVNHLAPGVHPWDNPGSGFGLGVGVGLDAANAKGPDSVGSYGWSGAASTHWWNDPREDITGIVLTQYMPMEDYPLENMFRTAVYQALT